VEEESVMRVACGVLLGIAVCVGVLPAQDLPPFPFEVPAENGWDDYVKAAELIRAEGRPQAGDLFAQGRRSLTPAPDELAQWKAVVDANADALALIERGTAKESVVPPEQALGIFTETTPPFPTLSQFRELARLLVLTAHYRLATGDGAGAAGALADTLSLGHGLERGGTLIHRLVGIACEAMALGTIHDIVMRNMLDADSLGLLAARLGEIEPQRPPLSTAWVMEEHGVSRLPDNMFPGAPDQVAEVRRQVLGIQQWMARTADRPFHEAIGAELQAPAGPLDQAVAQGLIGGRDVFRKALERDAACLATLRGVQIMIALERYKLVKGAYPRALDALVPEYLANLPEDPFSQKGFIYVGDEEPYRLYSVGPNMTDDGGAAERPHDSRTADLVFNIERPPEPAPVGMPGPPGPAAPAPAPAAGPMPPGMLFGDPTDAALFTVWMMLRALWLLGL
jgi:hypothetical protein